MSEHDDIAGLSDGELNREIAEAIGLASRIRQDGIWDQYWNEELQGWFDLPDFATDFNALLATSEHGGFVGPVAWLDEKTQYTFHGNSPIVRWLYRVVRDGPRALANDLLRAIRRVKEAEDG